MTNLRSGPSHKETPLGTRKTAEILTLPVRLATALRAATEEEQRAPAELAREAIERFLKDRRWQRLVASGQARARELGLTQDDLPRLIAEARQELRRRPYEINLANPIPA